MKTPPIRKVTTAMPNAASDDRQRRLGLNGGHQRPDEHGVDGEEREKHGEPGESVVVAFANHGGGLLETIAM